MLSASSISKNGSLPILLHCSDWVCVVRLGYNVAPVSQLRHSSHKRLNAQFPGAHDSQCYHKDGGSVCEMLSHCHKKDQIC